LEYIHTSDILIFENQTGDAKVIEIKGEKFQPQNLLEIQNSREYPTESDQTE
jgi:hypothetical protein